MTHPCWKGWKLQDEVLFYKLNLRLSCNLNSRNLDIMYLPARVSKLHKYYMMWRWEGEKFPLHQMSLLSYYKIWTVRCGFFLILPNMIFYILPSCEEILLAGECAGHECPWPWREFLCQDSWDFSTFRPLQLPCPSAGWTEQFSGQSNRLNHSKWTNASLSRK